MLEDVVEATDKKEVKKSGVAKQLKSIVDELEDENFKLHKIVKGVKNGISIAQDIAQWMGMPQVPKPFLKKE